MATPTSPTNNVPFRTTTAMTDEDWTPGEDTSEVTKLFHERLQAWKHACGYLEDYIGATEKLHHSQAKDYEKVLKTVSNPLKEGHHFAQDLGGIAGMFDNIRSNTQGIAKSHTDTEKTLKGSVLPVFERLHTEIKNKQKELTKGAGKGSKNVDKARTASQKHIEKLGQHTATFDSAGGKMTAANDPYVLRRGVMHLLNKQIIEENNNRTDIIAVQNSFSQFEAHVIATLQTGMGQFMQVVNGQSEQQKAIFSDITATCQRIAPDFEWNGFVQRNNTVLIDPSAPPRTVNDVAFPNDRHRATQPMIAGSLEKKGKLLKKYDTNYYVITPSKFLHEYKTDDDFQKEPAPEISLYLPDCLVGAVNGQKFNVKGKDVSGSSIVNKMSISHEFQFKAHTPADAEQWYEVIKAAAGNSAVSTELAPTVSDSAPSSPAVAQGEAVTAEKQSTPLTTTDLPPDTTTAATPVVATGDGSAPVSGVEGKPGQY
ncbi:hypothetical protein EJ05DRAFT_474158 [Pseudovirgaria hyperparasitica]|uniref:PH domain-containing protein n=1 Tax=Pseudovirgaria hyperparasitica TaxID=470096 RepID=A0A6A6WDY2_9PEZI|nr:uncharacterized protein EJ05DRAFT_474158 [Pseudovirgaria hyperparasitica]KAF2760264.1 hypothetical protein EJ05DRAFT_474158 [Pseudovirgaria hyperparasitica]